MDTSWVKADIFFVVTTAAVIIVTALLVAGLVYTLSILHTLRNISRAAQEGAETVVEGIHEAKDSMQEEGYVVGSLLKVFKQLAQHKGRKSKR